MASIQLGFNKYLVSGFSFNLLHLPSQSFPVALWVLWLLPSSRSSGQPIGPWPGPTLCWALWDALPQALPARDVAPSKTGKITMPYSTNP